MGGKTSLNLDLMRILEEEGGKGMLHFREVYQGVVLLVDY